MESGVQNSDAIAQWDVLIVGAGPAGLSAALILGRCCRRVLLCDTGTPRSFASHEMHGFVTRDGMDPNTFRAIARDQLRAYPNVHFEMAEVTRIGARAGVFEFEIGNEDTQSARKVLLATGVFDQLPDLPGIEPLFGTSVHPCPYCEGWEMRERRVAVYGKGTRGFEMARAMTAWVKSEMVLCTNDGEPCSAAQMAELKANGIEVIVEKIDDLVAEGAQLRAIRFSSGRQIQCEALFFDTPCHPQSDLAKQLGCHTTPSGAIECGDYETSSVPGIFAAGNILEDVQLSIVAAGEGARAAFGINRSLTREDFARRAGASESRT
jgi:thioredoxin reductase